MGAGFFALSQVTTPAPTPLVARCGICRLYQGCHSPKMPYGGKGRKRILICGEAPGKQEDAQGKQFVGESGQLLQKVLGRNGIDLRTDCYITNALICRPPGNEIKDPKWVGYCQPNLIQTVKELEPEVIILLGATPVRSLMSWLWHPDVGPLGRWLGWQIPCQQLNAWVSCCYHPAYLLHGETNGKGNETMELLWEQQIASAVSKVGSRPFTTVPDYKSKVELIHAPDDAVRAIHQFTARGELFAFDYETDRLKPDHPDSRILCCALSSKQRTIAFPWTSQTAQATATLLTSNVPKIGYNDKFESRWTYRALGVRVKNWVFDGALAAHTLDNRPRICGLKFQAFCLLGQPRWDTHLDAMKKSKGSNDRNQLHKAKLSDLLLYCGLDALLEYEVAMVQSKQLGIEL